MDVPKSLLVRVGRRVDYESNGVTIDNGVAAFRLTPEEFVHWKTMQYSDKLAEWGLIADDPQALIPSRNGILWDLDQYSKPQIHGIPTQGLPQDASQVVLSHEDLALWKQANGLRLLTAMTDCSWSAVIRLVSHGVWTLHWSREVL